jgi:hypothetical protein
MIRLGAQMSAAGKSGLAGVEGAIGRLGKLGGGVFSPMMSSLVNIGGGIGAGVLFKRAIEQASGYQDALARFDVVFGKNAEAMKKWAEGWAGSVGIGSTESIKFLGATQNMLVGLDFSREEAAGLSKQVVVLAKDLAAFNALPTAQAMEAIERGLLGQGRGLRDFGIKLDETKIDQELWTMGVFGGAKAAADALKAQAALNIIIRESSDANGAAARQTGTYSQELGKLKSTVDDLLSSLGKEVLPQLTPLIRDAAEGFKIMGEEGAKAYGKLLDRAQKYNEGAAVHPLVNAVLQTSPAFLAMEAGHKWAGENFPVATAAIPKLAGDVAGIARNPITGLQIGTMQIVMDAQPLIEKLERQITPLVKEAERQVQSLFSLAKGYADLSNGG